MGLIRKIFGWVMVKKLKNDEGFILSVKKADEAAEKLRNSIKKAEASGVVIPEGLKKYTGNKK